MDYTVDYLGMWRSAAGYVDRLLKGTKLEELPIQQPTAYFLDINLVTAKALSLTVPPGLLVIARELID
jgi:putative tryptophan/tyrosine transport system substrate-binding protein